MAAFRGNSIWYADTLAELLALGTDPEGVAVGDMGMVTGVTSPGLYRCATVASGSSTWVITGASGGDSAAPGFFDSTLGSPDFCCHFDEEIAGTWTSVVGNDLTVLSGSVNTPVVVGDASRPVTQFNSGGLDSGAYPALVELGDVSALMAVKFVSGSSGGTQRLYCVADTVIASANDNISHGLLWASGDLAAQWEHSFGTDTGVTWTGTDGPGLGQIGAGWHVLGFRRNNSTKEVELFVDHYSSGVLSYGTSPTNGSDGHLVFGGRATATDWVIGMMCAGAVIYTGTVISNAIYHTQVDNILKGVPK